MNIKIPKDWRFYLKWIGLALIVVGAIGHVSDGFDYAVLGLYIFGIFLFLSGLIKRK